MKSRLLIHHRSPDLYRRPEVLRSESGLLRTLYAYYQEFLAVLEEAFGVPLSKTFGRAFPHIDTRYVSYRHWMRRFLLATIDKVGEESLRRDMRGERRRGRRVRDRAAWYDIANYDEDDGGW